MHFSCTILLFIFLTNALFKPTSLTGCTHQLNHQLIIVKRPVADMFERIPELFDVNSIGAAPEKGSCPRDHQGIYNEAFCVLHEEKDFVTVTSSHIQDTDNNEVQFKIKKEDVININKNDSLSKAIPALNQNEKIITLLFPWSGYSIGTQFVTQNSQLTNKHCSVLIPDFENNRISEDTIPAIMTTESLRNKNQKLRFLECIKLIVKNTTGLANYTIPYVWGGTSFIANHNDHPFHLNDNDVNWHLNRVDTTLPYSGFDCSGLVWRTLQMIGRTDHPRRNSSEMAQKLKNVNSYSQLQNGDLLWLPGHIVVIANIKKGTIIEARGYSSGYGKVQKINLQELFENISSFETLFQYKQENLPIYLKTKTPNPNKKPISTWACLSITQSEK